MQRSRATGQLAPKQRPPARGPRLAPHLPPLAALPAAPGGVPVAPVPHGPWQTTTVVAALRADGLTAPLLLAGPLDGPACVAYVEQFLAPPRHPDDSGVLDNMAGHQVAGGRPAIEAVGARVLFLPPASPDFNPSEPVSAQLKARLRAGAPRTVSRLWATVGSALATVSPTACAHSVRHAGCRLATVE